MGQGWVRGEGRGLKSLPTDVQGPRLSLQPWFPGPAAGPRQASLGSLQPALPLWGPSLLSWDKFPVRRGIYLWVGTLYPSSALRFPEAVTGDWLEVLVGRVVGGWIGDFLCNFVLHPSEIFFFFFLIRWWLQGHWYQEKDQSPVVFPWLIRKLCFGVRVSHHLGQRRTAWLGWVVQPRRWAILAELLLEPRVLLVSHHFVTSLGLRKWGRGAEEGHVSLLCISLSQKLCGLYWLPQQEALPCQVSSACNGIWSQECRTKRTLPS